MAQGTQTSNHTFRIAVSFKEQDWFELNSLASLQNKPVTALIRELTLKSLKEMA